jgi:dynactin 1
LFIVDLKIDELVEQNSKLREALTRLHSTHTNDKTEFTKKIRTLEKESANAATNKAEVERLIKVNNDLQATISELKESLDDAQAFESLVESLTEKNLTLNEKVAEMSSAIEEFEELKDINEEMEEQHKDYEKQLRKQIDDAQIGIQHLTLTEEKLRKLISEKDQTISSFRSAASKLTAEKNQLLAKIESLSALDVSSRSQIQEGMSIALALNAKATAERRSMLSTDMNRIDINTSSAMSDFFNAFISPDILGE